ncbi:MAG: hypothetical protein QHH13_13705 [Melioribacter sp.]|uniref:hypothetical protein n=1 Tax=Rosettibacter primus TaxID=3111523 RepID=UPI00247EA7E7|nr:hypothetical protein [Melioribacter sp.]
MLYSKESAGEIRAMLYVALDINYMPDEEFKKYYTNAINFITQIANFITYFGKTTIKHRMDIIKSYFF